MHLKLPFHSPSIKKVGEKRIRSFVPTSTIQRIKRFWRLLSYQYFYGAMIAVAVVVLVRYYGRLLINICFRSDNTHIISLSLSFLCLFLKASLNSLFDVAVVWHFCLYTNYWKREWNAWKRVVVNAQSIDWSLGIYGLNGGGFDLHFVLNRSAWM